MKKLITLSLAMAMLTAGCSHLTPNSNSEAPEDTAEYSEGEMKDIGSFRLSDPEGPKLEDRELNTIPTEVNEHVEKWIAYFQGRGRPHMEKYLARSTRYEKLMKKVLRDNGLPEDLFYIALIESGFSSHATSHASAVGYWQFIRGTGKRYGLDINAFVDERRDPVFATQAAAEYFKGLYSVFGSWYLAMASYNVGENRVKREVMNHYTRDFWELARKKRLPRETIEYVPKFIAAKMIGKNPEKYGFVELDYLPPIEFDHITLNQPVNLRQMAEKLSLNYEDFKALNPKYKGEIAILKKSGDLTLRVPPGTSEQAIVAATDSIVTDVKFIADAGDTQTYKIRRGDTLSTVARRYRTSVAYLRDLNDLPKRKPLRVGMRIQVPDRTPVKNRPQTVQSVAKNSTKVETVQVGDSRYHIVQSGDSLFSIAKQYSTTINELQKLNNIKKRTVLKIGMKIKIPGSSSAVAKNAKQNVVKNNSSKKSVKNIAKKKIHVVRRGENLSRIAEKYKVAVADLKQSNNIRNPSSLHVGAKILIPDVMQR